MDLRLAHPERARRRRAHGDVEVREVDLDQNARRRVHVDVRLRRRVVADRLGEQRARAARVGVARPEARVERAELGAVARPLL